MRSPAASCAWAAEIGASTISNAASVVEVFMITIFSYRFGR
jgi:hypothetical protein